MQRHGGVEIGLGGPHFHGDGGELHHLGGALADNVTADHPVSLAVDDQFQEHRGVAARQRRLERPEHRFVDVGLWEFRPRLGLGEADGADLGLGEHCGRHIGVIDDGSEDTGELMNMLSRRNLLYRIVTAPDPHLDLNIRLGSKEYPKSEAADPSGLAQKIRAELTDEKRLLRVYGSEVVIARLVGTGDRIRIHLLNYANRPVTGLRIRVLGNYPDWQVAAYDKPDLKLEDFVNPDGATEFTVPEMSTYAVIDLSKRPR